VPLKLQGDFIFFRRYGGFMVHDPATLTLQAALQVFYETSEEGVWVEMLRQARGRAKADKMPISEAIMADLVRRLAD